MEIQVILNSLVKTVFRKNKHGRCTFPYFNPYYKTIINNILLFWHKDRHIELRAWASTTERFSNSTSGPFHGERIIFSMQVWDNSAYKRRKLVVPLSHIIFSNYLKDLNVNTKTIICIMKDKCKSPSPWIRQPPQTVYQEHQTMKKKDRCR